MAKTGTAQKMMEWQKKSAANKDETMVGSIIAWREIDGDKGRGVFALRNIKKGEVIETAPVVPVSKKNVQENGEAPDGYLLEWDSDTEDEEYCMVLGYVMLYNHGANPNMALESDLNAYTVTVRATRDIQGGEELTWDYACDLWFESVE